MTRPTLKEINAAAEAAQAIGYAIGVLKVFVRDRNITAARRDAITMAIGGLERVVKRTQHVNICQHSRKGSEAS